MTQNKTLAEMQAELDALLASTPPVPAVFSGPATPGQQAAATEKPLVKRTRGTSPIRTKGGTK